MSSGFMSKTCPVTVFKVNTPAVITLDKLKQFSLPAYRRAEDGNQGRGLDQF